MLDVTAALTLEPVGVATLVPRPVAAVTVLSLHLVVRVAMAPRSLVVLVGTAPGSESRLELLEAPDHILSLLGVSVFHCCID